MTMPTASPPAPVAERIVKPSALEVCDRCGADALWRVTFPYAINNNGELLFCGHHAVKHGFAKAGDAHAAYATENKQKGSDS